MNVQCTYMHVDVVARTCTWNVVMRTCTCKFSVVASSAVIVVVLLTMADDTPMADDSPGVARVLVLVIAEYVVGPISLNMSWGNMSSVQQLERSLNSSTDTSVFLISNLINLVPMSVELEKSWICECRT